MQGEAAMRTRMRSLRQSLADRRKAAAALLACAVSSNWQNLAAALVDFVFQEPKELAPAGIVDVLGQPAASESGDVCFDRDERGPVRQVA